eukprot:CAMPEP_0115884492 /NCGR_PEP_ID=MMETSP0287-20121206/30147_1 /TAXON_ID=412157 /ORGANISM="Chrysochromulina rotalis, Strain UIO044" /LENGTH=101 /DNA_ID=CAMNT_0003340801 /DNA_START=242 /DNA_END=544 /DNA_ORIENTATION=-
MMLGSGCRGQNRIELAQRACAMLVTERAQKPVVDASPVEAMRTRQPPDRLPLHKRVEAKRTIHAINAAAATVATAGAAAPTPGADRKRSERRNHSLLPFPL